MNHRTTRRDLETELHQFIKRNQPWMTDEAVILLTDVHSLLVHRTGEATATARQRDFMGAALRDSLTRFHALRVVYGDLRATEMVATIQKQLDMAAEEARRIGGSLAAPQEFD